MLFDNFYYPFLRDAAMERSDLIRGLLEIDPTKPYGAELFDALARLTVNVAVEAVCLRLNPSTQKVEVYMTQRSPTDTAYPGEWHCPGSVMRPGEDINGVFARLSKREFDNSTLRWRFIANVNPSKREPEIRGTFLSMVYLCVLEEKEGLRGKWFPVDELPERTVEHHRRRIIPCAQGAFLAENSYF